MPKKSNFIVSFTINRETTYKFVYSLLLKTKLKLQYISAQYYKQKYFIMK